mmetsp:Transcript_76329/g.223815  ORF Transcript_76329/g.223815 Transcript_76329/m.223815 type:complete len:219 (+) Transcript_76329:650-1306(+)
MPLAHTPGRLRHQRGSLALPYERRLDGLCRSDRPQQLLHGLRCLGSLLCGRHHGLRLGEAHVQQGVAGLVARLFDRWNHAVPCPTVQPLLLSRRRPADGQSHRDHHLHLAGGVLLEPSAWPTPFHCFGSRRHLQHWRHHPLLPERRLAGRHAEAVKPAAVDTRGQGFPEAAAAHRLFFHSLWLLRPDDEDVVRPSGVPNGLALGSNQHQRRTDVHFII